MAIEAKDDVWDDVTRQNLATIHIYSSQATAAESQLLFGMRIEGEPATCKHLIEQSVKQQATASGFSFDRTGLADDKIVKALWQELELRGIIHGINVAIVSEEDTNFARALCSGSECVHRNGQYDDYTFFLFERLGVFTISASLLAVWIYLVARVRVRFSVRLNTKSAGNGAYAR
jgi:hypothetical protein